MTHYSQLLCTTGIKQNDVGLLPRHDLAFLGGIHQQVNTDPRTLLDAPEILCRHFVRVVEILSEILIYDTITISSYLL